MHSHIALVKVQVGYLCLLHQTLSNTVKPPSICRISRGLLLYRNAHSYLLQVAFLRSNQTQSVPVAFQISSPFPCTSAKAKARSFSTPPPPNICPDSLQPPSFAFDHVLLQASFKFCYRHVDFVL